ncbi:MAG TPA: PorV/PorQ family protein [Ignavibacteria bacterium]|nr:PorV/PorQ family protein [Ignavibacteria bacterium]
MRSLIKYIILLITIVTVSKSQNDGAGNTGLAFLKLGITSRSIAMGEAVVGNTFDASATHYNPAALFVGSNVNMVFMHNEQVLGVRTEFLAGKVKFNKLAIGFSLNNTSVDKIQIREIPGESLGEFTAQNFAMGVSMGYKVNENLSVGLTGKFLFEKIYVDNASGVALDLGGLYIKDKLTVGASITNLGSMSDLRNEATKLPSAIRFGGSYYVDLVGITSRLIIAADGYKVMDGGKFHANTGAELLYKDFLALRVGYQSGYENKSIAAGIGLKYKAFALDYAFVPYKYSLGSSHTITLGTNF